MMRKLFAAMGMMLLASTLTNCSKDDIAPNPQIPESDRGFSIHVDYVPLESDTRTTFDPATGKVAWDANDELLVFCVEAGTSTGWTQYKFTTTAANAAQGIFTCPTLSIDPAKRYDWYVMNNYAAAQSYMKNPTTGTWKIGNQTQTGITTDHLTAADAIVAAAMNVSGSPEFTLRHVGTLMKFTIVNKEQKAITPTSLVLKFTDGTTPVAGIYTIDYATAELTQKTKYPTTTLTLSNAPELAPNATMDTYIVMPPFTIASGKTFSIMVTDQSGQTSEQTMTPGRDITFVAGKINTATLNFHIPATPPAEIVTGNWTATNPASGTNNILDPNAFMISGSKPKPSALLNGLTWIPTYEWATTTIYLGNGNNKDQGLQVGSKANPCRKMVLSTTAYGSQVSSVSVRSSGAAAIGTEATITVSVNGKAYTTPSNVLTKTATDFVFTPAVGDSAQSGQIVITITNPTAKASFYLSTFSIKAGA